MLQCVVVCVAISVSSDIRVAGDEPVLFVPTVCVILLFNELRETLFPDIACGAVQFVRNGSWRAVDAFVLVWLVWIGEISAGLVTLHYRLRLENC